MTSSLPRSSVLGVLRLPVRAAQFVVRPGLPWRFPWRPPRSRLQPTPVRDRVRVQVRHLRGALGDEVAVFSTTGDDGDAEFFYHPTRVLVRTADVGRLAEFLQSRKDVYVDDGGVIDEPIAGELARYRLPDRRSGPTSDLLGTLDDIDRTLGVGVVTPDHLLVVTAKGYGNVCPGTEPAVPSGAAPVPSLNPDSHVGEDVRVAVVDTGWYPPAAANPVTSWLGGVDGDIEKVDPLAIHEYAGHGTFVAGIVRCLAPGTKIEIEGFLTQGGAVYESEITKQLYEAYVQNGFPELISVSAGGRTRKAIGMIAFDVLARLTGLLESTLMIAAAGNDGSDEKLYPAAFDWVIGVGSVDGDGAISDFSNYGPWVDVYAQGRDLVNAFPTGRYTCFYPENVDPQTQQPLVRDFTGLAQWSGTSFSTPVVTGVLSAAMHAQQTKNSRKVLALLMKSAVVRSDKRLIGPLGNGTYKIIGPPFT